MLKKAHLIRLAVLAVALVMVLSVVTLSVPKAAPPASLPTLAQLSTEAEQGDAQVVPSTDAPQSRRQPVESTALVPAPQVAVVTDAQPSAVPTDLEILARPVDFAALPDTLPTALPFPTLAPFVLPSQNPEIIPLPAAPVPNQLVITFNAGASEQERAAYIASLGGVVQQSIDALDMVVIEVSGQQTASSLPASSLVAASEPDYYVSAQIAVPPSDPLYAQQWALPAIGASDAWVSLPANLPNVTVAVIDSGVCLSNPDLQGRVLPGWDYVENDNQPQDTNGHGCGVSNIIAANGDNGIGIAGVAPNAMVLPLRVLDAQGIGTYSNVAAAVVYAVDHGAQVINLSLGGLTSSSVLENAVTYAVEHGVMVVAAAGNSGSSQLLYPAAYTPVVAVGSVDQNLQISSFSNGGANVDLLAPGRNILTSKLDGGYETMSGTSFAAPHVAGVAAVEIGLGRALTQASGIVSFNSSAVAPTPPIAPTDPPACDVEEVTRREAEFQAMVQQRQVDPRSVSDAVYNAAAHAFVNSTEGCYESEVPTEIDDDGQWMPGFGPSAQYVLFGTKWGANTPYNPASPPGTAGGTVTYSFMGNGISMSGDATSASVAVSSMPTYQACFLTEIQTAFAAWSAVANISFVQVADNGVAFNASGAVGDIRIGAHTFDGPSGTLAHAFYPPPNGNTASGDLHYDSGENWTCNPGSGMIDIGIVTVHEIGHAIGLDHSQFTSAIMYPFYNAALNAPQADDVSGIQLIYGSAGPTPTPPTCPSFPYNVPASNVTALINAITCANTNGAGTNDVINLTNSTYTLTAVNNSVGGSNGLPSIVSAATAGTLTINGNGATISRSSAGGTAEFRILNLATGANLTLNNVTINNGRQSAGNGGAILSAGTLNLTNSTVSNSQASEGGGIYNTGTLAVSSSNIVNNNAIDWYGGGISNFGSVAVSNSTLTGNSAGTSGGALDNTTGTMKITGSTITENSSGDDGGAISAWGGTINIFGSSISTNTSQSGGAISMLNSALTIITNSTLYGNVVSNTGGAIYLFTGTLRITNSTITGNTGVTGAGIALNASTVISNSIIANSITGGDCIGSPTLNNSLIEDGSCGVSGAAGSLSGDPTLGALTGSPAYYPLGTGSIAINAGNNSFLSEATAGVDFNADGDTSDTLTTDQTGGTRLVGSAVDMGAVESSVANAAPTISDVTDKVTNEDTQTPLIPFTIGDPDTPVGSLTVTGTSSNQTRVPDANITITGTGASRNVRIKPALNQFGTVTITLTVSDGTNTAFDTFVLTITAVNDAPTITNITNLETPRNTPVTINFTVGDVESSAAALTLTGSSNSQARVPNGNIVFGGSGANRSVTITPALNQIGNARITICVSDSDLSTCDDFVLSIVAPPDAIFSNGFESGSLSGWTANANGGGDLSVTSGAALMGGFGLQAVINDTTPIHVTDDTPSAETRYRARFMFDPNSIVMATNQTMFLLYGYQGDSTVALRLQLRGVVGGYQLRTGVLNDSGTTLYSSFFNITDAPHMIELDWQAATASGANDGSLTLWMDEVQQTPQTGIDNDMARIDRVRLGAVTGIQAGTSGTMYFDAFVSRRSTYIGYLVAAPTLSSPADGAQVNRESAPNLTWGSVSGATQYYAEFTNGTTVNVNSGWIAGTSWSPGSQPQGAYTWRVKTRDASGEESNWSASRTLTIRPGVPTNLQGTAVGSTNVNLTWTASVDAPNGITSYRIYREGVLIGSSNKNTPSFTDNAAVACAANHYKVRAVNGTVSSPDSTTITVNMSCEEIFSDGFESGNLSAWSANANDGGDLSVTSGAHLTTSTFGLQAVINDTTPIHVTDDTPNNEIRYRARFYFDPNSISMGTNETMFLFFGYQPDSSVAFRLQLRRVVGGYQLRTGMLTDSGTTLYGAFVNISDAPHVVEIDWQAASALGANNGSLTLWLDEVQQTPQTGIDNDTLRIDRVRLGAVTGIQAGTSGTLYFDAFRSTRTAYIGAEVGGLGVFDESTGTPTVEPTVEPTAEPTADITPEVTPEATIEPTVEPTETPTVEPTLPPIEPTLLPFSVPVYQTMDDGAPLWSASAGWQLSADAAYSGLGWRVVASGNTKTLALEVPVNLAGAAAPMLSFQSKLVSGVLPDVRVSFDGVNWQTVASVMPSLNWALITVDLSAYAGQVIQLQFAWATPAGTGDSWQVDEVTIADGVVLPPVEPTVAPTEPAVTVTPDAPGSEPPVFVPTPAPREGGAAPDAPADLPSAPTG